MEQDEHSTPPARWRVVTGTLVMLGLAGTVYVLWGLMPALLFFLASLPVGVMVFYRNGRGG